MNYKIREFINKNSIRYSIEITFNKNMFSGKYLKIIPKLFVEHCKRDIKFFSLNEFISTEFNSFIIIDNTIYYYFMTFKTKQKKNKPGRIVKYQLDNNYYWKSQNDQLITTNINLYETKSTENLNSIQSKSNISRFLKNIHKKIIMKLF
jgi:hypothetical protein